jgi:putative hydroxymethylpyrimidine transport system permease protein
MGTLSSALRTLVTLLLSWQAATWIWAPPRYILPAPLDVLVAMHRQPAYLLENALVTVAEVLAGFALGSVLGALTALGIAAWPRLGRLVWPMVLVLQAFPVFVLAPLLVIWLGFGMSSKVVMATVIIFFPVTSAFGDGLRRIEQDLLDATALTDTSHWQTLWHIRVPLALPSLVSGLRVAAPLAPLGAVVGEWVGASAGLGFVMIQANARMQTDMVFAAMTLLAALALLLRHAVDRIAPRLTPWAQEQ